MNTIIMGLPTFHHQREAGAAAGVAVILTPLTITVMKTITITTDMSTTITGAATKTRTMDMMTSRRLGEDEEEEAESAVVPARTGAVAPSHQGADWVFPRGEALEQAAEVNKYVMLCFLISKVEQQIIPSVRYFLYFTQLASLLFFFSWKEG